jgi:uncharacterized membrane protein YcaP (DUF421 family)
VTVTDHPPSRGWNALDNASGVFHLRAVPPTITKEGVVIMPHGWAIIARSVIAFIALVILCRVAGKKFDAFLVPAVAAVAGLMSFSTAVPLAALAIWGILTFLFSWARVKSYMFRRIVDGAPTVVIDNGQILEKSLAQAKLTVNDMMQLLREKNVFKLSDVEFGVLETDGQLSVMKKTEAQPVTPATQGMLIENEEAPRIVILDGRLMHKALADLGLSPGWLHGELLKQGAQDYDDVFLAQVDSKGNLYVDLKLDAKKPPQSKARPLVLATLKKCQADLESYALATQNTEAKQMYQSEAQRVQQLIDQVQPYLHE